MSTVEELQVEALFCSDLQPSQRPGSRLVWETVLAVGVMLGEDECAARVAQEFGDHPQAAAERMAWCRRAAADAFAVAPA